jgi:hypothetical protein
MRLNFPTSQVIVPFRMEEFCPDERPIIVVWEPDEGEAIPLFLAEFVKSNFGIDPSNVGHGSASARYLYARQKNATLIYALLPASEPE